MLFLGLNEKSADEVTIPLFLIELRRSAFAQIYADDTNMAVFLGRPPRLNRKFCSFQLPTHTEDESSRTYSPPRPMANENYVYFHPHDRIDRVTGIRWTACCASIQEDILEALQDYVGQPEDRQLHFR